MLEVSNFLIRKLDHFQWFTFMFESVTIMNSYDADFLFNFTIIGTNGNLCIFFALAYI